MIHNSFYTLILLLLLSANQALSMVYVLYGTSCAGKSSIAFELQKQIGDQARIISFDEIFSKENDLFLSDKEKFSMPSNKDERKELEINIEELSTQRIHKEIKKNIEHGNIVVLDLIRLDNKDFLLLKNYQVKMILVYCSLNKIIEHLTARNALENDEETRDILTVFEHFYDSFDPQDINNNFTCDILQKSDCDNAFEYAQNSLRDDQNIDLIDFLKDVDTNKQNFVSHFNFDKVEQIAICHDIFYDIIVHTDNLSPSECAAYILEQNELSEPTAIIQNYLASL